MDGTDGDETAASVDGNGIERDESHDWYIKDGVKYPPVTKVLRFLDEDTTGLDVWKDKNDGIGDSPHHEHLFWFARVRGTLTHYDVLNRLADRNLWGSDEARAMSQVLTGAPPDEYEEASDDESDVVYSVMANHRTRYPSSRAAYDDDTSLIEILNDDIAWVLEVFDGYDEKLGISDGVRFVEQYVVSERYQYGGQADLIYEDRGGNVVVCDLKTSGSFRQKHRLQVLAYARAVEEMGLVDSVDRLEVIWASPKKEATTVYSNWRPAFVDEDADWFDADQWFVDEYGNWEYEDLDAMWATVEQLAHEANTVLGEDDADSATDG